MTENAFSNPQSSTDNFRLQNTIVILKTNFKFSNFRQIKAFKEPFLAELIWVTFSYLHHLKRQLNWNLFIKKLIRGRPRKYLWANLFYFQYCFSIVISMPCSFPNFRSLKINPNLNLILLLFNLMNKNQRLWVKINKSFFCSIHHRGRRSVALSTCEKI